MVWRSWASCESLSTSLLPLSATQKNPFQMKCNSTQISTKHYFPNGPHKRILFPWEGECICLYNLSQLGGRHCSLSLRNTTHPLDCVGRPFDTVTTVYKSGEWVGGVVWSVVYACTCTRQKTHMHTHTHTHTHTHALRELKSSSSPICLCCTVMYNITWRTLAGLAPSPLRCKTRTWLV